MTNGLYRVIDDINSSLDKKLESINLNHPYSSISSSQTDLINSYRAPIIAQAVQIYTVGNNAIADVINDILNEKQTLIMQATKNKLIPEQIEFIITNELYPDLMREENLVHIKDIPKKTIDLIFEILGEENIQQVVNLMLQLDEALYNVYIFTEDLEIETSISPNNNITDANLDGSIPSVGIIGNIDEGSNLC
ncbi:MAG: hypothetical protein N4A31_01270 [Rickettsiales bacterium]|jgi:hypothetical protein|nr:hypothetical protein [Rickettsiales bacterium]